MELTRGMMTLKTRWDFDYSPFLLNSGLDYYLGEHTRLSSMYTDYMHQLEDMESKGQSEVIAKTWLIQEGSNIFELAKLYEEICTYIKSKQTDSYVFSHHNTYTVDMNTDPYDDYPDNHLAIEVIFTTNNVSDIQQSEEYQKIVQKIETILTKLEGIKSGIAMYSKDNLND